MSVRMCVCAWAGADEWVGVGHLAEQLGIRVTAAQASVDGQLVVDTGRELVQAQRREHLQTDRHQQEGTTSRRNQHAQPEGTSRRHNQTTQPEDTTRRHNQKTQPEVEHRFIRGRATKITGLESTKIS